MNAAVRLVIAAVAFGNAVLALCLALHPGAPDQALRAGFTAGIAYLVVRLETRMDRA